MGLIDTLGRIPNILTANLDDLLDKVEDPIKMMKQLIKEGEKDLSDTKDSLAACMTDADSAQDKLDQNQAEIDEKKKLIDRYMNGAHNAAKSGKEADAKQLLRNKQVVESELKSLETKRAGLQENKKMLDENVKVLEESYRDLETKISDLKDRLDVAKGKDAAARGQERVNKTIAGRKSEKALSAFDRYEEKTDKRLKKAQAANKLDRKTSSGNDELLEKYSGGSGSSGSVDEEYEALMAELNS